MGALNYRYGVRKELLPEKLFGVFPQYLQDEYCFLTNGFDKLLVTLCAGGIPVRTLGNRKRNPAPFGDQGSRPLPS